MRRLFLHAILEEGFINSFTYTYIKENGHIELIGSLSDVRDYTIIYFDMNNSLVSIEKDVEGLSLDAGESTILSLSALRAL